MADLPKLTYSGNDLLDALFPKKPAKTTTTVQRELSTDATDRLIQKQLEADANFAAISRAESGAGLYDSTTSNKLANDLAVRNAGEVAVLGAPQVTTAVAQPEQASLGSTLGQAVLGDILGGGKGISALSSTIGGILGGSSVGGAATAGIASGVGSAVSGAMGAGAANAVGTALGTGALGTSAASAAAAAPAAGLFAEGGLLSGLGNLGGALPALGPVGIALGVLSLFGLGKKMSIICTELHSQGKLTDKQYARGYSYVRKHVPFEQRVGYFTFAPAVVARIRKNPAGLECKAWAWFFATRTQNNWKGKLLTKCFAAYCSYVGKKALRYEYA